MSTRVQHQSVPTVGIVGAGQLARMTVQAAISLGVTVRLLAASPDDSAALIDPHVIIGEPSSAAGLAALATESDVITFDHELVDVSRLRTLEGQGHRLRPGSNTVAIAQDKAAQRDLFARSGLPVPAYRHVRSANDMLAFAEQHGWPIVAKATRGGYDGRGVWLLEDGAAAARLAVDALAAGTGLIVEERVAIERELAVLVARRPDGQAVLYPVVETVQVNGICREVLAPARIPAALAAEAQRLALEVARVVDASGVMALELFLAGGRLTINEIAARLHNSGHYTIEGCLTSQFENHLRAVLDWPLGATALVAPAAAMVNVIAGPATGDLSAALPAALAVNGVRVHLYGKTARPGRKVGHVTALGERIEDARARAVRAAALLVGPDEQDGGPDGQDGDRTDRTDGATRRSRRES